jgi:hypothetical protein
MGSNITSGLVVALLFFGCNPGGLPNEPWEFPAPDGKMGGSPDLAPTPACTGKWVLPPVPCTGTGPCQDGNPCTLAAECRSGVCAQVDQYEDCRPCRTGRDCCGEGLAERECSEEHTWVYYTLGQCDDSTHKCKVKKFTSQACRR